MPSLFSKCWRALGIKPPYFEVSVGVRVTHGLMASVLLSFLTVRIATSGHPSISHSYLDPNVVVKGKYARKMEVKNWRMHFFTDWEKRLDYQITLEALMFETAYPFDDHLNNKLKISFLSSIRFIIPIKQRIAFWTIKS